MLSDLKTAIVVNGSLPLGLLANTVGAIAIGLGASNSALGATTLTDGADRHIDVSSRLPVPILQADGDVVREIMLKGLLLESRGTVVPFPAFARSLHDFSDYAAQMPSRDLSEEIIDGVGLVGPAKWVRSLTGALRLLR